MNKLQITDHKISTVLLDLDGTLRDTRNLIYEAYQHAIRTHSGREVSAEDIKPYVHHSTVVHKEFAAHVDVVAFEKTYSEVIDPNIDGVPLYEGTKNLLALLKSSGLKVGIVTSAPQAKADSYMKSVGLFDMCGAVVGVSPELRPKPAPDMLLEAIRQLKGDPETTIMIGDMAVDVLSAHAAGVKCIGVTHGFSTREELVEAGADYMVDSLAEIEAFLSLRLNHE